MSTLKGASGTQSNQTKAKAETDKDVAKLLTELLGFLRKNGSRGPAFVVGVFARRLRMLAHELCEVKTALGETPSDELRQLAAEYEQECD